MLFSGRAVLISLLSHVFIIFGKKCTKRFLKKLYCLSRSHTGDLCQVWLQWPETAAQLQTAYYLQQGMQEQIFAGSPLAAVHSPTCRRQQALSIDSSVAARYGLESQKVTFLFSVSKMPKKKALF